MSDHRGRVRGAHPTRRWLVGLCAFWLGRALGAPALPVVVHDLDLDLDPARGRLRVEDQLRVPRALRPGGRVVFDLRAGLEPSGDGVRLEPVARPAEGLQRWRLTWPRGHEAVRLRYRVRIDEPGARVGWLSAHEAWLPEIPGAVTRFRMRLRLPAGWSAVSEGSPWRESGWCTERPVEGVDLLWGRFHRYTTQGAGRVQRLAYLLEPDETLAQRYLDAAGRYLTLYSRLIAPYPYPKFALVENDRQTGLGFPSFTLLGSRVLRLPFIVDSAFPHEIVHNWWGNGVYIDGARGNWSEGLTTYFADYALREAQGRGAEFRRTALQKYADYVQRHRDLPLAEFRSRHDERAHAVGYHKGMMFFHMLRRRLGDEAIMEGMRRFWDAYQGRRAGFAQLREALEAVSGTDLAAFFRQWVQRAGAPELALGEVRAVRRPEGWRLRFELRQRQSDPAFDLVVPVAVGLMGRAQALETVVHMNGKRITVDLPVPAQPTVLAVDPAFDVFRRLDRSERPPSLGSVWGAERIWLVLPPAAPAELERAWLEVAAQWRRHFPQLEVEREDEVTDIPPGTALWLVGERNRLLDRLDADLLPAVRAAMSARDLPPRLAWAAAARKGRISFGVLHVPDARMLPALARKLPHYGRYGLVAFEGEQAANRLKLEWPVRSSVLRRRIMPSGDGASLVLAPRRALLDWADREPDAGPAVASAFCAEP